MQKVYGDLGCPFIHIGIFCSWHFSVPALEDFHPARTKGNTGAPRVTHTSVQAPLFTHKLTSQLAGTSRLFSRGT